MNKCYLILSIKNKLLLFSILQLTIKIILYKLIIYSRILYLVKYIQIT